MNTPALLQPHLLETDVLRDYLRMRCLPLPNIEQLPRPELLRIFGSFAVPMHQRPNKKAKTPTANVTTPISPQKSGSKRKHDKKVSDNVSTETKGIEANLKQCTISRDYTTIEEVTHNYKQIKLGPDNKRLKRLKRHNDQMETSTAVQMKRQRNKITWP